MIIYFLTLFNMGKQTPELLDFISRFSEKYCEAYWFLKTVNQEVLRIQTEKMGISGDRYPDFEKWYFSNFQYYPDFFEEEHPSVSRLLHMYIEECTMEERCLADDTLQILRKNLQEKLEKLYIRAEKVISKGSRVKKGGIFSFISKIRL